MELESKIDKLEIKKNDIARAIDGLDTVIKSLIDHEEYKSDVVDLEMRKSALECDFDEIKKELDELYAQQDDEWEEENKEQVREYMRSVI